MKQYLFLIKNILKSKEGGGLIVFGVRWIVAIPFKLLSTPRYLFWDKKKVNWNKSKRDILSRANWLCDKVLVEPSALLDSMPRFLGEHYMGEWAIYTCSMLVAALSNIVKLYPEEQKLCLSRMRKIIEIVLSPELRSYDSKKWREDPLDTLSGDNSHMTYLSILSWCITNYKLSGGSGEYDTILRRCCEALSRRMQKSPDMNLQSFPDHIIFFPDMLVAIVALRNYSILYNGHYSSLVSAWIRKARNEWIDENTGLLYAIKPAVFSRKTNAKYSNSIIRGSYTALSCHYLTLIDTEFAKDQYDKMKKWLIKKKPLVGIKEYLHKSPPLYFDVDAGPVVCGLSPSGTAFSIGSATFFNDYQLRCKLLRSGEIVGQTVNRGGGRHYRLGEMVLVGESTVLAMKTNIA